MSTSALLYETGQLRERGWDETAPLYFYQSDRIPFEGSIRFPLRSFQANAVMLETDKPVEIKLYFDQDIFFVENESLHIFATGQTIDEALAEFNAQVVHFYNYYMSLENNQVQGQAQHIKHLYTQHFRAIVNNAA